MNIEESRNKLNEKSESMLNIMNRLFESIVRKRKRKIEENKTKNNLVSILNFNHLYYFRYFRNTIFIYTM